MNLSISKEEKKCPECGIIKDRKIDFYQLKGHTIKVNGLCKSCLLESNVERRRIVKEQAIEYLGGKCQICGYDKCQASLDFHHLDPNEKDINFYNFKSKFSNKLKMELDKCILLCSNCHRELHYNERTLGKH